MQPQFPLQAMWTTVSRASDAALLQARNLVPRTWQEHDIKALVLSEIRYRGLR